MFSPIISFIITSVYSLPQSHESVCNIIIHAKCPTRNNAYRENYYQSVLYHTSNNGIRQAVLSRHYRKLCDSAPAYAYALTSDEGRIKLKKRLQCKRFSWSEWGDSNTRPLGPEPSALPNWATPRNVVIISLCFFLVNRFLYFWFCF